MIPTSRVRQHKHAARWVAGSVRIPEDRLIAASDALYQLLTAPDARVRYTDPLCGGAVVEYRVPDQLQAVFKNLRRSIGRRWREKLKHLIDQNGVGHGFGCCKAGLKYRMIRALFRSVGLRVTDGATGLRLSLRPGESLTLLLVAVLNHLTPHVGRGSRFLAFRDDRMMLCEFRGSHMLLCWTDPTRSHSSPYAVRWDRLGCSIPMRVTLNKKMSKMVESTPIKGVKLDA